MKRVLRDSEAWQRLKALFDSSAIDYEVIEHEPVFTSEEADRASNRPPRDGVKALLLKANGEFVLCAVRGDHRLDSKKLRAVVGTRKIRFASPEEVEQVMGVTIGACYPFSNDLNIPLYGDATIADNTEVLFSPGRHDCHVRMSGADYLRLAQPKLVDITTDN